MGLQQETLNAIAAAIGVGLANFLIALFVLLRANRTRKEVSAVRQDVSSVKEDVPKQIQSQMLEPLQKIDAQISGYVQSGEFYRKQMESLIADSDGRNDRTLAELSRASDQLRIAEQTNSDLKEFINDQFKERAIEFDKRRELEACVAALQNETKELRATNDAYQINQSAHTKQIEHLQTEIAETRRELVQAQANAENARKDLDSQRTEKEQLRQQLVLVQAENEQLRRRIEELQTELTDLKARLAARDDNARAQLARQAVAGVMKAIGDAQLSEEIAGEVVG